MTDENDQAAAGRRRAIILIPGMKREERFVRRDILINNLEAVERHPLTRVGEVVAEGEPGLRLSYDPLRLSGETGPEPGQDESGFQSLDVFEAYWADMIPEQSEQPPWTKLYQGLELVGYWVFSLGTWRAVLSSLSSGSFVIAFGLVMGGLTLVAWYILLAVLVGQTVAPGGAVPEELQGIPLVAELVGFFGAVSGWLASHAWWAVLPFLLTMLRVDAIVLLARFIKDYFENREDENGVGLRDRLRRRIATTLRAVMAADYDEVIIVAHSFGTVLATDILADWPHRDDFKRLTVISLGSPITVLRHRSAWLEKERTAILGRQSLRRWVDFFAPSDWLCGEVPGHRQRYGEAMSQQLSFEAPWPQRLSGRTHLLYYRDPRVMECLAGPQNAVAE